MTSFGDVNVGDKVRLTHKTIADEDVTFRVAEVDRSGTGLFQIRSEYLGWFYESAEHWSVEVLEPAPKPLPSEPGLYVGTGASWPDDEFTGAWVLTGAGKWVWLTAFGMPVEGAPTRDLTRLVRESAVEEARNAMVKEIVKFLYRHDDRSFDVAANKVDLTFGGKA